MNLGISLFEKFEKYLHEIHGITYTENKQSLFNQKEWAEPRTNEI